MARELVYTSAKQGILPGSQGFCSVALSQGMPASMRLGLEAMSGYRMPPGNPAVDDAPIEFLHATLSAGGERFHVLGAVRAAPPDHSGRGNKFAHFVVLERGELDPNGPVAVLQTDEVIRSRWPGAPELLPPHRVLPPALHRAPGICHAWQELTGDAGWAGALASDFVLDASKPTHIIVPHATNVLRLVDEAVALLPPEWRWRITFSTYWQRSLPNHVCAWRFLLDGTPEATAARQQGARVFDLAHAGTCPREGRYVEAARSGLLALPDITASLPDEEARHQHQMRTALVAAGDAVPDRTDVTARLGDHEPVAEVEARVTPIRPSGDWSPSARGTEGPTRSAAGMLLAAGGVGAIVGGLLTGVFMWVGVKGKLDAATLSSDSLRTEVSVLGKERGDLTTEVARTTAERDAAKRELADAARAQTRGVADLQSAKDKSAALQTEVDGLRRDLAAAKREVLTVESAPAPPVTPTAPVVPMPPDPVVPTPANAAESGGLLRSVPVSNASMEARTLGIAPGSTVTLYVAPELMALGLTTQGARLSVQSATGGTSTPLAEAREASGGAWEWVLLRSQAQTDLSSFGGYDGLLRGSWLDVSNGTARETIVLRLGESNDTIVTALAPGQRDSLKCPAWVERMWIVPLKSGGAAVPVARGANGQLTIGAGEATLKVSLATGSVGVEFVSAVTESAIDDDFYVRALEFSTRVLPPARKLAAAGANASPNDDPTIGPLGRAYANKKKSGDPPPTLTKDELLRLRDEVVAADPGQEGDSKSVEFLVGTRGDTRTTDAIFTDFADFLEAARAFAQERVDAGKRVRDAWPVEQFAIAIDGVAPGAPRGDGQPPAGTIAVLQSSPPKSGPSPRGNGRKSS